MEITETKDIRRTVVNMAWPAVLRTFLNMVVQMADMVMVGRLGAIPLAAVGLGNQIFFFSVAVVQAFSIGTTALVAQAIGRKDLETARRVARQSLAAVLLTTLLLSIPVVLFSDQIIRGLVFFMPEKDLELLALGGKYLGIIGISISLRFSLLVVNGIFQGAGDSKTPLYLMLLTNLANVVGNYLFIFGPGPFPALGVQGAALATCGSGILGGGLGIWLLFSRFSPIALNFSLIDFLNFQKRILLGVLSIGVPSAIEQVGVHFSQIIYTMIIASLGSLVVAAHQILHNAYLMTFLPGIGFSLTAATMVGQFLGAEQREKALQSGLETVRIAFFIMSAVGVLFFFFSRLVTSIFTAEQAVIQLCHQPLVVLAFAQPALAVIATFTGGLRGAGDTRWAMALTLFNLFVIRLLLTILLVKIGLGLTGVWLAMLVEAYVRSFFLYNRFREKIPQTQPLITSF